MIRPEITRHLHFVPHTGDGGLRAGQPHAAIIAFVHSDRLVNLSVLDANGVWHPKTSVPLVQPEDAVPTGYDYCCWMPFSVEQAKGKKSA